MKCMKKQLLSLVIVAAFASNAYAADVQDAALLPGIVASAQTRKPKPLMQRPH
ncbi:MAG: hypothetical protein FD173_1900 [Gallionellaceae bacterium]|nr:MAG: hypothetical protein FD173_1900 [Gallionellaceae bacterium]